MSLEAGTLVDGKYRVVRLLGEGGMGAVYEGENIRIKRRVALKVLHASLSAHETAARRFEQEAKAAGMIGSEHIVEVLDFGSLPSGELFLVMEFLEGEDMGTRIKRQKRLLPEEAAPLVHQLLEGLSAAHKTGIIHRDLKPENVFLVREKNGRRDFVKVLDFGVSKFSTLAGDAMSMTRTGAVVGTPYYLSPEQARGLRNIDARSDLYSVGVVMYQAVTGTLPFSAETFNELVFKIALESPPPAETVVPDLDPAFAGMIRKAMEREADARFASAKDFQAALAQWMASRPAPHSRPAGLRASAMRTTSRSGTLAMEAVATPASPWPSEMVQQARAAGGPQPYPSAPSAPVNPMPTPQPQMPYAGYAQAHAAHALPTQQPAPHAYPQAPQRRAPPPSRTKHLALIGAGLGAMVLIGLSAGAYFIFSGGPQPSASASAPSPVSAAPSPIPVPSASASAKAPEPSPQSTAAEAPASTAPSAEKPSAPTPLNPKSTPTAKPTGRRIGNEL